MQGTQSFEESYEELKEYIAATPVVTSLLYDLNLLPEELESLKHGRESKQFSYMVSVVEHFQAFESKLRAELTGDKHLATTADSV